MGLSSIQWCDYTFNPWIGCRFATRPDGAHIEECFHCYAKTLDDNRYSKTLDGGSKEHPVSHWGSGPRHRTSESNWKLPLKWNAQNLWCPWCNPEADRLKARMERHQDERGVPLAPLGKKRLDLLKEQLFQALQNPGCWREQGEHKGDLVCPVCLSHDVQIHRPRVFCASLSDWLDDENVPIEWLADLLKLIHDTPHLDWLLLTKRPQNFIPRMESAVGCTHISERIGRWIRDWRFASIYPNQIPANVWIGVSAGADQEAALAIPARIHFLSCEPMLRPLETTHAGRFDWIIFGGESGSKARDCHTDWIRDGVAFCRANGVTPFVKQLGSNCYAAGRDQKNLIAMKDSHGGEMSEWPEDLRVREFPLGNKGVLNPFGKLMAGSENAETQRGATGA